MPVREHRYQTSPWARKDPSSASLTRVQEVHTSIRTSGQFLLFQVRPPSLLYSFFFFFFPFGYLSLELARNVNSAKSTTQTSATDVTASWQCTHIIHIFPGLVNTQHLTCAKCRVPNLATSGNDDTIVEASEPGHGERRCELCPLGTATRSRTTHFLIKHARTFSDGTAQVTLSHIYTQPLSGSENESKRENLGKVDHAVVTLKLAFTWSFRSNVYHQICKFSTKLLRAIFMLLMNSSQSFDDLRYFSFFI